VGIKSIRQALPSPSGPGPCRPLIFAQDRTGIDGLTSVFSFVFASVITLVSTSSLTQRTASKLLLVKSYLLFRGHRGTSWVIEWYILQVRDEKAWSSYATASVISRLFSKRSLGALWSVLYNLSFVGNIAVPDDWVPIYSPNLFALARELMIMCLKC
jgi:hypothetical protein